MTLGELRQAINKIPPAWDNDPVLCENLGEYVKSLKLESGFLGCLVPVITLTTED
jgi:hypothetical protein